MFEVVCANCGNSFEVGHEIEGPERDRWICGDCAPKKISLELLDFIKERIALPQTEYENYGRFVVRELVQNADDAEARILVLRFDSDALYVANDGRAFTAAPVDGRLSDFERISRILQRHQATDPDTTGHFGSGFQTVYAITKSPEVHSGGRSGRMDPVRQAWDYYGLDSRERLVSPYAWKESDKGVLFRLPWRDDSRAEEEFGEGEKSFSNPEYWPRWNAEEQREMYDDLRDYIHYVLLCCNNLRSIRLVWASGKARETYQTERDFSMNRLKRGLAVGIVREGFGRGTTHWYDWDNRGEQSQTKSWSCYQEDGWRWGRDTVEYSYLISSSYVTDEAGKKLHVGRTRTGWALTPNRKDLVKPLKAGEFSLLLPMFDATKGPGGGGNAYLYSTIPLPRRGKNWFAFTGHFFPEEGRGDVAVTSLDDVSGEWHRAIVLSVARQYVEVFPKFLKRVHDLSSLNEIERQAIVMNAVPAVGVHDWMRPGKEPDPSWAEDHTRGLRHKVLSQPILWTGRAWVSPLEAYWARSGDDVDSRGRYVLDVMGEAGLTEQFVGHPNFESTLREPLLVRTLDSPTIVRLFGKFVSSNGGPNLTLTYGQALSSGKQLDMEEVSALIEFCITREDVFEQATRLPVVPGADGVLRPLADYGIVPVGFEPLKVLLTPSMRIHPDFVKPLEDVHSETRTMGPDDVVEAISQVESEDPKKFEDMVDEDYRAVSEILASLCRHQNFALKQSHLGRRFIPYRYRGTVRLGPPNALRARHGGQEVFLSTRPEPYERHFIFLPAEADVPGLTPEVSDLIRFLALEGNNQDDLAQVGERLYLKGLQEGPVPTNFVRHFLSNRHGSLFRNRILSDFLGTEDEPALDSQKKSFLEALKAYYGRVGESGRTEEWLTPEHMGVVPCLYDQRGRWGPARDFALELRLEVKLLRYRSLHRDFEEWPEDAKRALGVATRPESGKIIEVVRELLEEPRKNRKTLANIVALIVTSREAWEDSLRELTRLEWIPTVDGGFRKPEDVLAASEENTGIVGTDFEGLFDLNACSEEFVTYLTKKGAGERNQRIEELGMAARPTVRMMRNLVSGLRDEETPPPVGLLDSLNEAVQRESLKPIGTGFYHHEDAWWEGSRIFLQSDGGLKESMGESALFLTPDASRRHFDYLIFIGAKQTVKARDVLEALEASSEVELTGAGDDFERRVTPLWDWLEASADEIDDDLSYTYSDDVMYFSDGQPVSPSLLIFTPTEKGDGIFRKTGSFGTYVIVNGPLCPHPKALTRLGARLAGSLKPPEIRQILESLADSRQALDQETAETVVRLLGTIYDLDDSFGLAGAQVWPMNQGETYTLSELGRLYLDDDPASRHFEGKLPFLFDTSDGMVMESMRYLAMYQDDEPLSFAEGLALEGKDFGKGEEDEDVTRRLRRMAAPLRSEFQSAYDLSPESIDWLENARALKVGELNVTMRVKDVSVRTQLPCLLREEDGSTSVYWRKDDPRLIDRLTQEIVSRCETLGLQVRDVVFSDTSDPVVPRAELIDKVYRLLTRSPDEWHFFMRQWKPVHEWIPPIPAVQPEPRAGYPETRQKLMAWYGFCQVCGARTPADEHSGETRETVKSIVTMRRGAYRGEFLEYTPSNSLLLCPRHHTLFARGLVKFTDAEEAREMSDGPERLRAQAEDFEDDGLRIDVFEGENRERDAQWYPRTLHVQPEHAKGVLTRLAEWLESDDSQ